MPETVTEPKARFLGTPLGNIVVLAVTACAVLGGLWFSGVWRSGDASAQAEEQAGSVSAVDVPESGAAAPAVGTPAPQFTATTLAGDTFDLAEAEGPVWLVFSATWCANCRAEAPEIEDVHEQYGEEIEIVSIYLSDSPSTAISYSTTLGLTHPQVVDPNSEIGSLYRVMGVPSHYFIDSEGILQAIEVGVLSPAIMNANVAAILK